MATMEGSETHDEKLTREYAEGVARTLEELAQAEVGDPDERGEDGGATTIAQYADDCMEAKFMVDSNCEYEAVRLCCAFGGPNCYIDTFRRQVECYWWLNEAKVPISDEVAEKLDEWGQEAWEYVRGSHSARHRHLRHDPRAGHAVHRVVPGRASR